MPRRKQRPASTGRAFVAIDRVFERHGSWHYDFGRDEIGARRSLKLARVVDGEPALLRALAKVLEPKGRTMHDLFVAFKVHGMEELELATRTRFDYCNYIDRQLEQWCGKADPNEIKTTDVAKYYKRRKKQGAGQSANKEVACLSSVFQYALGEGWAEGNPCRGVRRNKAKARTRYVRHDEFLLYFNAASERLQDLLAGIYLMELRPGEARALRSKTAEGDATITPKGVVIEESKTGKTKLVEWSPALQFFLTRSTSRTPQSEHIFTNSRGEPWTESAMHSALALVREKLPEGSPRWTFHDIRAKGESDHRDGGHGLLALYKRATVVSAVR